MKKNDFENLVRDLLGICLIIFLLTYDGIELLTKIRILLFDNLLIVIVIGVLLYLVKDKI